MRSIRWLAAVTGALALGTACGGDNGGGVEPNEPPVASFTAPSCTVNVPCSFTSTSTDDHGISSYSWSFGDGTPVSTEANPSHTFTAAGTFNVSLTVTDGAGESNTATRTVTVSEAPPPPPPGNQAPVASFTFTQTGSTVVFTSTSTDADGTIASYAWSFGDNNTSTEASPTHSYAAVTQATTYTVTLTVTDDDGAVSTPATQSVTIQPPSSQECTAGTDVVDCTLSIDARASITITLSEVDCELGGNEVALPSPIAKQVFGNVCTRTEGEVYSLNNSDGSPMVLEAGTQLRVRFRQGDPDPGDPAVAPPAARLEGTYPNWTMRIDDGGNPTGPGEPDFGDVVLTIAATAAP